MLGQIACCTWLIKFFCYAQEALQVLMQLHWLATLDNAQSPAKAFHRHAKEAD
jgi:hypothetical protein